jgi:outer membrane lipoprotein SlyB
MNTAALSYAYASPGSTSHADAMNASAPAERSARPLWAAIGVLSVCVIAMGSSLVQMNNSKLETLAHAGLPLSSAQAKASPTQMQGLLASASTGHSADSKYEEKRPLAPEKSSSNATKRVANSASNSPSARPSPAAASQPPVAQCNSCGTVEAVTPITRDGQGSGVGAVAGGVLGGVVGNQVGKGSGRAVATVLGAVGGGWAGHTVERKMKKETVYSVRVRMQDGSSRTVQQKSAPMVGAKVTVDGSTLRPA